MSTTGLASYIRAIEPGTHAAIFNALLGLRCWRDLDNAETAMNEPMHQQALAQLDRGLNRALTVLLIDRLNHFSGSQGSERVAAWSFLKVLGPVLNRAANEINAETASQLAETWSSDGSEVDPMAVILDLNSLFPCP